MTLLLVHYLCISTPLLIVGIIAQSTYLSAWLFNALLCAACGIFSYFLWHTQYSENCVTIANVLAYCMGIISLGCLLYAHQWYQLEAFHNSLPKKKSYTLRGTVEDIALTEHLRTPHRVTLHIKTVDTKPCSAIVFLYVHHIGTIRVGDLLTILSITLKKPTNTSFTRYLLKEGIYATAFVDILEPVDLERPAWSLNRFIAELRTRLFTQLRSKLTAPTFALYSALFLGNRTFNKKETEPLNTSFKRWGIAHIYARSGMHLGLIVLVWFALMRYLPLPYNGKQAIVIMISIIYALLSWSSISFMRSLSVFLLYQFCRIVKESYSVLYLTILLCGITLLINPLQLFFLDFQLSYALTAALALLYQLRSPLQHK